MPHLNHRRGDTRQRENLGSRRCSCSMCGNPRRNGWDNAPTRQEFKAALEDEHPRRPKAKKGPKRFTIEKRRVYRDGTVSEWWVEYKRYRTAKGRDMALESFRRSDRPWWRHEYRAGPVR